MSVGPETEALRYWLAKFRRVFSPAYTILGKRSDLKGDYACVSQLTDGSFLVEIDRALSAEALEIILLHELAHVVAWDPGHPFQTDHGPEFGVAYSRVWAGLKEV